MQNPKQTRLEAACRASPAGAYLLLYVCVRVCVSVCRKLQSNVEALLIAVDTRQSFSVTSRYEYLAKLLTCQPSVEGKFPIVVCVAAKPHCDKRNFHRYRTLSIENKNCRFVWKLYKFINIHDCVCVCMYT